MLKQRYLFRMNQFNYNYQTKLSYVVGYIEPTQLSEPLPTAIWRTAKVFSDKSLFEAYELQMPNMPKTFYMRDLKNGDQNLGILMDLNNVLDVVTVDGNFSL
jgi:hypothetical protein